MNETSKALGFDIDATLRLASLNTGMLPVSLEMQGPIWDSYLTPETSVSGKQDQFTRFVKDDAALIQENYPLAGPVYQQANNGNELDPRTRHRVEGLAKLLHQPKEQVFRIPRCIGWKHVPSQKTIAFVFRDTAQRRNRGH